MRLATATNFSGARYVNSRRKLTSNRRAMLTMQLLGNLMIPEENMILLSDGQ